MSPSKQERLFPKEYAKVLWRIAEGDYLTVEVLAKASGYRVENAFYLAQQSIEKALRSVLVHRGVAIPMIHDLSALLSKLPEDCDPPYGYELNALSEYATIRRYEEGSWIPATEELQEIMLKTKVMLDWAKAIIAY
jgi:HEPN domain-containing protein